MAERETERGRGENCERERERERDVISIIGNEGRLSENARYEMKRKDTT